MMVLEQLAEQKIEEAMQRGEFDNLPGLGKPLVLDDLSDIPEDYRMAYKIMKNSGFAPPAIELNKEISQLFQSCSESKEGQTRDRILKKLQYMLIKLDLSNNQTSNLALQQAFYKKLTCHFSNKD